MPTLQTSLTKLTSRGTALMTATSRRTPSGTDSGSSAPRATATSYQDTMHCVSANICVVS